MTDTQEQVLNLTEEGYHQEPSCYNEHEEDTWIQTGWRVRTYSGDVKYRSNERSAALQWLAEHEYVVCGDGAHFRKVGSGDE